MPKPDFEIRTGAPITLRAEGETARVEGYAAVFNQPTSIGGYFEEVIAPGAFAQALARGDDTVFLIDHAGLPLARSSSGTLTMAEDARGLMIASDLDAGDPDVMRILPKMRRGDLSKMSFAFRAAREEWDDTGEIPRRTVLEVELVDVSIVTSPAYDGTEIGLRALDAARASGALIDAAANARRRFKMKARLAGLSA